MSNLKGLLKANSALLARGKTSSPWPSPSHLQFVERIVKAGANHHAHLCWLQVSQVLEVGHL